VGYETSRVTTMFVGELVSRFIQELVISSFRVPRKCQFRLKSVARKET
jgi:hypothetical protein